MKMVMCLLGAMEFRFGPPIFPSVIDLVGGSVAEWFSVLDSGAEEPGFKSQSLGGRVTVLGKLFTPIVPLFTKQQNW